MLCEGQTYKALELDKVKAIIALKCRSTLGSGYLHLLLPAVEGAELRGRIALLEAYKSSSDERGDYPWDTRVILIAPLISEAKSSGWLSGLELLSVKNILILAKRIKTRLKEDALKHEKLKELLTKIRDWDEEIKSLEVLDDDGRFYDFASPELRRVRDKIFSIKDAVKARSQNIFSDTYLASLIQDKVLSVRNGRYCVLVKSEAAGYFPGITLEMSSSKSSVYMEPKELIKLNNELAVLNDEEKDEEYRLLSEKTRELLRREHALLETEKALSLIDLYHAYCEMMRTLKWHVPSVSDKNILNFKQARHPLLEFMAKNAKNDKKVQPIDLFCGCGYDMLIVTGPNTGGKTVALKTAGICIYLAWLGCPVPCSEGSSVGEVSELFADIGDEQSIEQSLSTFSAHMTHLIRMLAAADKNSVLLLDELGAGTDPDEGSALGIALLEHFRQKKCLVVATTHHNHIKRYALATQGIETASMEFDAQTLSPTYRLNIGIPGKSNAILIAKKLGMPSHIIKKAREALSVQHADFEALVGELEAKKIKLKDETDALNSKSKEAEKLRISLEQKNKELEAKKDKLLEQADKKASSIVKDAQDNARALLKNLQSAYERKKTREANEEYLKKKQHFDRQEEKRTEREEKRIVRAAASDAPKPKVGDLVEMPLMGLKGELTEIHQGSQEGTVRSGAISVRVELKKLKRCQEQKKHDFAPQIRVNSPKGVTSSIMIRGMNIAEALPIAEQYMDDAYRSGYGEVAIIHGRGEGILRKEVQALCKRTPFVESYRLGGAHEGGYGVTIVRFSK